MALGRRIACFGGVAAGVAVWRLRIQPRLARWGATDAEVAAEFPGAELVPGGERGTTMAETIGVPPSSVWPWLVQLGGDRGGWYSWDRLDNGGRPSADRVHPEWQELHVGDHVKYWTRRGPEDAWRVDALEPDRFLALHGLMDLRGRNLDPGAPRPKHYIEGVWAFRLTEVPGHRTRLVVSGYQRIRPRWLERVVTGWLYVPVVWIMQSRMLSVLRRNIEAANRAGQAAPPTPTEKTEPATGARSLRTA